MTQFIAVFRPHQRPAWAEAFRDEDQFLSAWENGYFARSCNAEPDGDGYDGTFDAAWADAGHDMHALTRLDSREEVERYLSDREYAGHHNRALSAVRQCAEELGWLKGEDDDEEDED